MQSKDQYAPLWENPEIQEINRLPMGSPLVPFASIPEAVSDALAGPAGWVTPGFDASYVEDQDQWWLGGIHRSTQSNSQYMHKEFL